VGRGLRVPKSVTGKKADGVLRVHQLVLDGWAGAYLNRQGYYSAVLETAKAKMEAYEWAYWMEGKAANARHQVAQWGLLPRPARARRRQLRGAHGRHRVLERDHG